jgi:hypothetical protein
MVLSQTIEIGQVYEVKGYGYPMLVERMDRMIPLIVKSVTLRPATQVDGVWRTYGMFELQIPGSRVGEQLVKKIG